MPPGRSPASRVGSLVGRTAWTVPDVGEIILRFVARRDSPVPGRHAVLIRRRSEPAPTFEDLDLAVASLFRRDR